VTKGLLPACVEVCPTEARIFGDLKGRADRLVRFHRANKVSVLKPDLNTEPKVLYAQLDGEVR
jgi:Fe-S-cluster-containing dehydrogenase component